METNKQPFIKIAIRKLNNAKYYLGEILDERIDNEEYDVIYGTRAMITLLCDSLKRLTQEEPDEPDIAGPFEVVEKHPKGYDLKEENDSD